MQQPWRKVDAGSPATHFAGSLQDKFVCGVPVATGESRARLRDSIQVVITI